jgi:hypothetical protein
MSKRLTDGQRPDATEVLRSVANDIASNIRKCLDSKELAQVLTDGLRATHREHFLCQKTGEIVSTEPEIDHSTRLRAGEILARLSGLGQSKEIAVTVEHGIRASDLAARRQRALESQNVPETTIESCEVISITSGENNG